MNQGFDSREIYTDLPDEVVEFHGKGPLGLEPPLRCRSVLAGCAQVGGEVPLTLPKDGRFECTSHAKRKEKKRKKKTFRQLPLECDCPAVKMVKSLVSLSEAGLFFSANYYNLKIQ